MILFNSALKFLWNILDWFFLITFSICECYINIYRLIILKWNETYPRYFIAWLILEKYSKYQILLYWMSILSMLNIYILSLHAKKNYEKLRQNYRSC